MTYTTLQYNGVEKSLADWGISTWSRVTQNQGEDSFTLTLLTPMDGSEIFPYGANIIVRINRTTTTVNAVNPTLPQTGSTSFSGGTQWFWGYCIDNDRVGDPNNESFTYKFVGPYQFFFERLIFQKYQLTWNGTKQIVDWQSDIVLGLSLTTLTGTGDTVAGTTATNLMSIAQQIKEICMFAQSDSAYQQANNGLSWPTSAVSGQPANAQFQCDQLTTTVDGVNWDLLSTPSTNVLIADYAGSPASGKTSASTLPSGSYMLRCPLDAANAITCAEAMRRQLQWLGGIGSPVVWTDHSQTPPQLHVSTRAEMDAADPGNTTIGERLAGGFALNLPLTGIAIRNKIKARYDLLPAAAHFKYKIAGTVNNQPYSVVINDVAAGISGSTVEGIGQLGALQTLSGSSVSSGNQTTLMALAKTAASIVQTFDFQGSNINCQSAPITVLALNLADPTGGGSSTSFWQALFPELANVAGLKFYDATHFPVQCVDAVSGSAVTAGNYGYWLQKGNFYPWMTVPGTGPATPTPGTAVKVRLTAFFGYTEQAVQGSNTVPLSTVARHEKNIEITLTNLNTSATYYSAPQGSTEEPIPYGLAGYVFNLESILQYEGSVLVQETEISDVCPLGNSLNITGGLEAWSTMMACVQSVRYSDNGQTEITFGPAKHLGPSQFIARFRANAGPRWYSLIPTNPLNVGSQGVAAESTNPGAQAPSAGAKNPSFISFFGNLPTNMGSPSTLPQGVHIDAAGNWGGNSAPGASGSSPQVIVAGTAGGSQQWIRIAAGDLPSSAQAYFQGPYTVCLNGASHQVYFLMAITA